VSARLVQLDEDGRRTAVIRLGPGELVIGRDAREADLVVEHSSSVSRRHAAVRDDGEGGYELVDLGSANGTTLNGERVGDRPLALEDGDRIELGGDVELLYEIAGGGSPLGAILAVLLLGALAAGGWWWWSTRTQQAEVEVVMARAATLAREGMTASEAGNPEMAKQRFQSAAGLLFREGLLDDVERDVIMRTALERIGARLGGNVDLWLAFKRNHQELAKRKQIEAQQEDRKAEITGTATKPTCRLDAVGPAEYHDCLRQWVRQVLHELRQEPRADLPNDFLALIAERQCVEHGFIRRSLGRGASLVPMMEVELEKKYLPRKMHYLSLIESGYQLKIASHAGAVGPWQFMPGTARDYGLNTGGSDDRTDPVRATQAAGEYLNNLLMDFGAGDLLLALASYNTGEGRVRGALRKLDDPFSERSYWRLVERDLLHPETKAYVARFLAAAAAGEGGLPSMETLQSALNRRCKDD
jgi:hypothetical protein